VDLLVDYLDFSSCPALDVLKIKDCTIRSGRILSQSVKHLIIKDCYFQSEKGVQKHLISVPNVILLKYMSSGGSKTPLIESMPPLETAIVRLDDHHPSEYCTKGDAGECCGTCAVCCANGDHGDRCILLGGLSSATNLELVAPSESVNLHILLS
jgi:hypothetical protein